MPGNPSPSHADSDAAGRLGLVALFVVFAAAVGLRVVGLLELEGDVPTSDELWRMNVASRSLAEILETPFHSSWARYLGLGPWGYIGLLHTSGGIAANPWLLRGLSFLPGLAIVAGACWILPRRLPRDVALAALLLFAAHPGLVQASQEIKENAWMALLAGGAAYFALRWVETGASRYGAGAAAAISLAATMHPVVLISGGALLLVAARLRGHSWRAVPWLALLLPVGLLLALPVAQHVVYSDSPAEVVFMSDAIPSVWERIFVFPVEVPRKTLLPEVPSSIVYFLGASPLIAWGGWRARREPLMQLGLGALALSFAIVWIVQLWRPTWVFPRYFTHLVPLLLVTVATAFAALPRRFQILGFALLFVPYLIVAGRLIASPREGDGFRQATHHLDAIGGAPPTVVASRSGEYLMLRYLRPSYRHLWLVSSREDLPAEWTTVFQHWPGKELVVDASALGAEAEIWWLRCDEDDPPPPAEFHATGERHGCVERYRGPLGAGAAR